jgi:hypothetical protein
VSAPQIDEADAVSIGESVSAATDALLISEAESVSLGESTNLELAYHASVSSAATASDSAPTAELTIEVIESETVSTADAIGLTVSAPQVTATDAISVGELSSVDIPGFGDRNVSVSETVSLGESTDLEIVFVIVEVEDAAPGESVDAAIPGYVLLGSLNYTNVPFDDRRSAVEYEEDRASVPFEDHRSGA